MLLSRDAGFNSIVFLAGWVLGLLAVGVIVLAFGAASSADGGGASTASGIVRLGIGALFLLLAARSWRARPRGSRKPETPRWLSAVEDFSGPKSFGVAVLLSAVNPKNLGLTIAAASTIAAAGLTSDQEIGVFAIFLLIASSTVAAPVFCFSLATKRAPGQLERLKTWLIAHNNTVMAVLLLIIAAKLIGDGIGILSG